MSAETIMIGRDCNKALCTEYFRIQLLLDPDSIPLYRQLSWISEWKDTVVVIIEGLR